MMCSPNTQTTRLSATLLLYLICLRLPHAVKGKFTKYKCVHRIRYRNSKNLDDKNTSIDGPNCGDIVTAVFQDKDWFQTEEQPDLWLPITHPGAGANNDGNETVFELVGVHVTGAGNTLPVNGWYIQRDYREARPTGLTKDQWDQANGYQSWYEQKIYQNHQPEDGGACYILQKDDKVYMSRQLRLRIAKTENTWCQADERCEVLLVNNGRDSDGYNPREPTTYFIRTVRPVYNKNGEILPPIKAEVGELRSRNGSSNAHTYRSAGKCSKMSKEKCHLAKTILKLTNNQEVCASCGAEWVPPRCGWEDHPLNGLGQIKRGQVPTVTPGHPSLTP